MTTLEANIQMQTARRLNLLRTYREASRETGIDVAVLMGKDSRESRLTRALSPRCKGDRGNGFGISQIDQRFYPIFTSSTDPCNHAAYVKKGARILAKRLSDFGGQIRPALASYNAGATAVRGALQEGRNVDRVTTGGDYSEDVLVRARALQQILPAKEQRASAAPLAIVGGAVALTYFLNGA